MTETTSVTGAFTRGEGKDATFEVARGEIFELMETVLIV